MAVNDEADAEQAIKERRGRARGHEGSARERDEACGKQTLESPVVGTVRSIRRREGCRVIHGALVDRWSGPMYIIIITISTAKVTWDVRPPGT